MKTTRRMNWIAVWAAAFGLVAGFARAATASDFCISYTDALLSEHSIVGKGFKLPPPGRCRPFAGFHRSEFSLLLSDVTGSACTAANGNEVRFALTETYDGNPVAAFFHVKAKLPLGPAPILNHGYSNGASSLAIGESIGPCSPGVIPVP